MHIHSICVTNRPPIKNIDIQDLSNMVVLAGPNGVGKTKLLEALLQEFHSPGGGAANLGILATTDREKKSWGSDRISTGDGDGPDKLRKVLQARQKRGNWRSSAIYFDSARTHADSALAMGLGVCRPHRGVRRVGPSVQNI